MSETKRPHGSRFRDALVIVNTRGPLPVAGGTHQPHDRFTECGGGSSTAHAAEGRRLPGLPPLSIVVTPAAACSPSSSCKYCRIGSSSSRIRQPLLSGHVRDPGLKVVLLLHYWFR